MAILDEAAAVELSRRLRAVPWVRDVALERLFPDRFRIGVELRRPVLVVRAAAGADAVCAVDGTGICLPVADVDLPATTSSAAVELGRAHPDPAVVAAAAVAVEWAEEIAPHVPGAPDLVEVDATNLGYRFLADRRFSEVVVGLRGADGVASLAYGHAPGSAAPRVPLEVKRTVLRGMLAEFPGLSGLRGGDLRFRNRWRDWLIVRPVEHTAGG
jgi:hypothetical protein